MRPTANPAPKTESAKEALRAFYCDLCDRGYSRISEYEAHLSSYTHSHKKNLTELKASQRDSSGAAATRERERIREEKELQRIMGASGTPSTTTTSFATTTMTVRPITMAKGGFKKISESAATGGGWKKVGAPASTVTAVGELNWIDDGKADYDPAYPTPA